MWHLLPSCCTFVSVCCKRLTSAITAVSMGGVYYRHAVPTFLSPAGKRVQRPQHTEHGWGCYHLAVIPLFSTAGIDHSTLNMGGVVTTLVRSCFSLLQASTTAR